MAPPPDFPDGRRLSSPSTPPPEPSFRELDDAYLQNQTRIWLGEVLNQRFDKDVNISDLLADGQILFGMYKLFRKMLVGEEHSSRQKFPERESVSSSEITEIFPYAKVERFLEVCQSLGLSDIDLFTTSDVVDKRNTRKVCMCLRSLAKKARSRNLNVPDFDSVTHRKKSPVSMPTYMVGNRRRDLERSSSSPVPDSHDIRKGSRQSRQEGFHAENRAYKSDVSDDDVDDSERYSVVGGASTDSSAIDTSPRTHPGDPSMVQDFRFVQRELEQLSSGCPEGDENVENECMSATESVDITSPSQDYGSGGGDNFQLMDDHSNNGLGNNLPNHSSILLDWQESGIFTAYDEAESNGGNDYAHLQLADGVHAVGNQEGFVHQLHSNLEEVNMNGMETTRGRVVFPLPVAVDVDTFASSSPMQESGKGSQFAVGSAETAQQGQGVDLSCENLMFGNLQHRVGTNDLPCIEDDDKDEREDSKDENKKVADQCRPPRKMLKLVAGGTGTVAAVGLLLFWLQLRAGRRNQPNARSFPIFLSKGGLVAFLGGLASSEQLSSVRDCVAFLGGLAGGDKVANLLR